MLFRNLYTRYTKTLQQISQASTPDLQLQLKEYRDKIKEAHQKLIPTGWSYSQLRFYDKYGARSIVGENGYTRFETALSENAANTPGAIQALIAQQQELSNLLANTNNILSSLGQSTFKLSTYLMKVESMLGLLVKMISGQLKYLMMVNIVLPI
jgi:hypothetical protein